MGQLLLANQIAPILPFWRQRLGAVTCKFEQILQPQAAYCLSANQISVFRPHSIVIWSNHRAGFQIIYCLSTNQIALFHTAFLNFYPIRLQYLNFCFCLLANQIKGPYCNIDQSENRHLNKHSNCAQSGVGISNFFIVLSFVFQPINVAPFSAVFGLLLDPFQQPRLRTSRKTGVRNQFC